MKNQLEIFAIVFFLGWCIVAAIRLYSSPSWAEIWEIARPLQPGQSREKKPRKSVRRFICFFFHWKKERWNMGEYPTWTEYGNSQQRYLRSCVNCNLVEASRVDLSCTPYWARVRETEPNLKPYER